MENGLSAFEEQAEKNLEILCKEKEKLQKKAYELKRRLLLCQKKKELEGFLDAQVRGDHGLQALRPSSISPLGGLERAFIVSVPPHMASTLCSAFDTTGYFCVAVYQQM